MKKFNLIVNEISDDVEDAEFLFETFSGAIEDYTMSVNLFGGKTLEMCLSDKEEFIKCMNKDLEIQYDLCADEGNFYHYDSNKLFWDYFYENFDNIYDAVDYFIIQVEGDVLKFLENHPKLQDKKIVLPYYINISDFEKVELLLNDYKDYPNIYVCMQGNYGFVDLRDCYKIMNEIHTKSEHIKSLNLSPAESVMYAYDLVRDRVYKSEEDDNVYFSRDLKDILFNDAIVCVGFARILACILDNLGIKNELVSVDIEGNDRGHMRNAVYLNDDKYDVHGYYHLDPTWDSKKTYQNDNYLYRYLYFLKTEQEMYELCDGKVARIGQAAGLNNLYNVFENLMNCDEKFPNVLSEIVHIIIYINFLNRVVNQVPERIIEHFMCHKAGKLQVMLKNCTMEDVKNIIADIDVKLNNSISAETFIELANNVRKIEHYIDPEKFPYSMNVLYNIYLKSGWEFKEKHYNPQELLLARIMGESDESVYNPESDFINFINFDAKISRDPSRVQFTKTLRKVLDKKNEQN